MPQTGFDPLSQYFICSLLCIGGSKNSIKRCNLLRLGNLYFTVLTSMNQQWSVNRNMNKLSGAASFGDDELVARVP
jgi:hypothetical protein